MRDLEKAGQFYMGGRATLYVRMGGRQNVCSATGRGGSKNVIFLRT